MASAERLPGKTAAEKARAPVARHRRGRRGRIGILPPGPRRKSAALLLRQTGCGARRSLRAPAQAVRARIQQNGSMLALSIPALRRQPLLQIRLLQIGAARCSHRYAQERASAPTSAAGTGCAAKKLFTSSRASAVQKLPALAHQIEPISVVNCACTWSQCVLMKLQAASRVSGICETRSRIGWPHPGCALCSRPNIPTRARAARDR